MPARRPSILFVNGVYPPLPGATGHMVADLAGALAAMGWDIRVVASGRGREECVVPGVRVDRVGGEPRRGPIWRRAVGYGATYARLVRSTRRGPHADVIVLGADPPLLFLAGPFLRRRTGAAVVHWAQDVYPDVAEALGVVPRVAARPLRALAHRTLRRLDAVVAIGRCVAARLAETGVATNRIALVPNWAPASIHPVASEATAFRATHGLAGRFVVMYSGTLGLAHPFEAVLDAAAELSRTDPGVVFALVGDGARRDAVADEARRRGLDTVRFFPAQPAEALSDSLGAADLHLVTMDARLEGLVVPSKVYGALASGRPVLFVGPAGSEAARVVAENGAGSVLAHSGPEIATAVRAWRDDPARRLAAGQRAAQAAPSGPAAAADTFAHLLERVGGRAESECEYRVG